MLTDFVENNCHNPPKPHIKPNTKSKLLSRLLNSSEPKLKTNGVRRAFSYSPEAVLDSKRLEESKRRQARLLLVSLLENFCTLYDQSPQHNQKLFFMICKTLSSMGLIDEEYIDKMAGVRSSYMTTFKQLVVQAMATMKQELKPKQLRRVMSIDYLNNQKNTDNGDYFSGFHEKLGNYNHTPSVRRTISKLAKMSFTDILELYNSRYETDFIEVCKLGKGGFGTVFKVQNKLDGSVYAIKKIRLKSDKTRHEKAFREIKYLSKLDHPNVVRYYGSWLENGNGIYDIESDEDFEEECDDGSSLNSDSLSHQSDTFDSTLETVPDEESQSLYVEFVHDENSTSNSSSDSLTQLGKETQVVPSVEHSVCEPEIVTEHNTGSTPSLQGSDLTLFIQMQLCHCTLHDYIEARNRAMGNPQNATPVVIDSAAILQLFRGIVQGVAYIHDQNMIHRDLKPMNIFLDCSNASEDPDFLIHNVDMLIPRIGDFGLVTGREDFVALDSRPSFRKPGSYGDFSSSRTSKVGTITYASPEQLADPPQMYDQKADIYSLGIILFELYHPFTTLMERAELLQNLRIGVLPDDFLAKWPKESALILWLMAEDPTKRPTAHEILEFDMFLPPTYSCSQQSDPRYSQLEQEVCRLQDENDALRARLAALEAQMSQCSCKLNPNLQ
ncbi:kinase-like protein [Basidiobolus meristosporus CBS 931.73]|uniref:Eukaryotic translation initiation factor 2-alpha kinase 1 n=1 Tax=Basidiobolus meristosporus CBS 931.73 TaxID=1314790 RepID=A0A1Y1YDE9_9FUNG|nr:kinase-like protein [Basidiobolus meristosporus CBS 931.73]|eukprot:ORX95654.1 kinase-like protein [Basidiobolus meristosporus CBS 931.73]